GPVRADDSRAMKTLLAALLALAAVLAVPTYAEVKEPPAKAGKAPAGVKYEGGDGSSMEKAVIIKGAKNEQVGVDAEYAWLAKKYPGYKTNQQALMGDKGKKYDMLSVTTADGKKIEVYFDITD